MSQVISAQNMDIEYLITKLNVIVYYCVMCIDATIFPLSCAKSRIEPFVFISTHLQRHLPFGRFSNFRVHVMFGLGFPVILIKENESNQIEWSEMEMFLRNK